MGDGAEGERFNHVEDGVGYMLPQNDTQDGFSRDLWHSFFLVIPLLVSLLGRRSEREMFAHHRERVLQQLHRADAVKADLANTLLTLVHIRRELVIADVCLPQRQTLTEDEIGEHLRESGLEVGNLHIVQITGTRAILFKDVAEEVLDIGGVHPVSVALAADIYDEFEVTLIH